MDTTITAVDPATPRPHVASPLITAVDSATLRPHVASPLIPAVDPATPRPPVASPLITAVNPSSASSPSPPKQWKHDVFLSFRGEETRQTFTDNLYWTLIDNKVKVFIDENGIGRGEVLKDELLQAITRSRMSVVIFSKQYAESHWCLEELEKIMECRITLGQIVLPIFYNVEPTDVRNQTGSVAEAFQKHAERFHVDEVLKWRSALTEAANLSGLNLRNTDGYEGKFIRKIVNDIRRKLKNPYFNVADKEIGIDYRLKKIINDLDVGGSDDVRIVGISGMVGTGKTTIAKAVFNEFHSFEGKSFLSKVRERVTEESMVKLQNQLLCDILEPANIEVSSADEGTQKIQEELRCRKVLVVFDDIDSTKQLEVLAIKHESFGRGSRIIVTTSDEKLLKLIGVDKTCLAEKMNNEEALELLSWHAFRKSRPNNVEYLELANEVVKYCGGLPLALKVLGSSLYSKSTREWRSALRKLKKMPPEEIYKNLKMSYDGIDDDVKAIFLDISCFFIGMDKDYVMTILDGCDFEPEIGIRELHDRCLVTVDEGNNLIMHDLLRDMGREIVRKKSPDKTGKRSRLWRHEDVKDVLKHKSGSKKVEGLILDLHESNEPSFSTEALKKMRRLRLLKLKGVKFTGNRTYLSEKLAWLCWPEFPLEVMPEDFNQRNLVDIDLSHSQMQVWKDSDVPLEKLKFLNLGYCRHLKKSPDFSKLPNLERLILKACKSLSEIDHSIVQLKCLKYFSLADSNLTTDAIPENLGSISSLEVLDLRGNAFSSLPILTGLSKLQTLQLGNCTKLQAIPDLPTNLEILEANQCIALGRMPDFSEMSRLRELHLNYSPTLTEIPGLDKSLTSMTRIHMEGCTNLKDAFKAILRGWSANGNGGLFLPGPSL